MDGAVIVNYSRVSAAKAHTFLVTLTLVITSLIFCQGTQGAAEPAYGIHITTDSGRAQAFYLALETDDVIVFKNWRVDLYGRANSTYSLINEISSELYAFGNFSYHTSFELTISDLLVSVTVDIDGQVIGKYERIRIKQNGDYSLYERDEIESSVKQYLLTNIELFWRDLKVSLGSILALGLAFQWRYGRFKKSAMMEVNDLV